MTDFDKARGAAAEQYVHNHQICNGIIMGWNGAKDYFEKERGNGVLVPGPALKQMQVKLAIARDALEQYAKGSAVMGLGKLTLKR